MKVLLITDSNFPFGGASANFLRLLCLGLSNQKIEVSVLIQGGKHYRFAEDDNRKFEISYKHCCFFVRPKSLLFRMVDAIGSIIVPVIKIIQNRKTIDCVLIYSSTSIDIFPSLIICKILRIKIVSIVVEWYEKKMYVDKPHVIIKWYDYMIRMKFLNFLFDGLIVLSTFLQNYYQNKKFYSEKILLFPNVLDFDFFECTAESRDTKKIRIGYCGTPSRKDGIYDLINSFKIVNSKHNETELLIIGDNLKGSSTIPQLKTYCESIGIISNVIFTGLVSHIEIPRLLKSCDILVLARPSGVFAEAGFPTKIGEYMATKIPVVLTAVGDLRLYFKDGENAMVAQPDSIESISEKIIFLIENPEKRNIIGINGYKWAYENLEFNMASKKVLKFINTL